MDVKEKIDEIVSKIKAEPDFASEFRKEPVKAVEKVLGVDLPDDAVSKIVDGVKAKVNIDGVKDKLGGLFGCNK